MNTLEAILTRKSTRAYKNERVSDEIIDKIIKAGCAAPVAMAKYDTLHITVIQNEQIIAKINDMTAEMFARKMGVKKNTDFGARTMLLVSGKSSMLPPEMEFANVGIVIENMIIAATSLGVDSVILGGAPSIIAQDESLVRSLGIPEGFSPVLGAFLGYATEEQGAKDHIISVNRI